MSKSTDKPFLEVVAALIWQEGRFLICRRPATKARGLLWEFVGGKVEAGETKSKAIARECKEELAILVEPHDVFCEIVHEYDDVNIRLTLFNCTIVGGQPTLLEHSDMRWITVDEIPRYDFCPADEGILAKLQGN